METVGPWPALAISASVAVRFQSVTSSARAGAATKAVSTMAPASTRRLPRLDIDPPVGRVLENTPRSVRPPGLDRVEDRLMPARRAGWWRSRKRGKPTAIALQLLGPVNASLDGRPVPLGATKQRAVLAMLALEPN